VYSCFGIFFTSLPSGLDANHRPLEGEKQQADHNTPVNPYVVGISGYAGTQTGFDVFSVYEERPAVLPGLSRVRAIASAERASFALRDDNTLWVWGQSGASLLAGATYPRTAHPQNDPVQITSIPVGVVAIAAGGTGDGFALAIDASGNVWSWATTRMVNWDALQVRLPACRASSRGSATL